MDNINNTIKLYSQTSLLTIVGYTDNSRIYRQQLDIQTTVGYTDTVGFTDNTDMYRQQ